MDGKQHFSVSIIAGGHPAQAPRWVGVSLPWSLHPLQNTHCEATLAASQARRHSMTDRRCTHCSQLNPSETLFPCWEEAPFLSNKSTLSCCFLSGLSLASVESAMICALIPGSEMLTVLGKPFGYTGTVLLRSYLQRQTNVWRAAKISPVYEKLQTVFLLGAAHYRKIDPTSQVWLWKGENSGLQLFSSAGLQHTLRSDYTLSIAFKTRGVRASLVPIMNSWEEISPCFPPPDLRCGLEEIHFYRPILTSRICHSCSHSAFLQISRQIYGSEGKHPSRELWGHGHLCWKPPAAATAELQTAEPECSLVLQALPPHCSVCFHLQLSSSTETRSKPTQQPESYQQNWAWFSPTLTPHPLYTPSQMALDAFFFSFNLSISVFSLKKILSK